MNQAEWAVSDLRARVRQNEGGAGGCILGCLVALGLVVLVIALVIYFGLSMFNQVLDEFTATAPVELPASTLDQEKTLAVWERVEAFKRSVEAGEAPEALELTGEEINALLLSAPVGTDVGNWIHVEIEGDKVLGEVSVALEKFVPVSFLSGRYFNGTVELDVSLQDGRLVVYADQASVKGEAVPEEMMSSLRGQNLAEEVAMDPDFQDYLGMIESIVVEDGVVKITPMSAEIISPPGQ